MISVNTLTAPRSGDEYCVPRHSPITMLVLLYRVSIKQYPFLFVVEPQPGFVALHCYLDVMIMVIFYSYRCVMKLPDHSHQWLKVKQVSVANGFSQHFVLKVISDDEFFGLM